MTPSLLGAAAGRETDPDPRLFQDDGPFHAFTKEICTLYSLDKAGAVRTVPTTKGCHEHHLWSHILEPAWMDGRTDDGLDNQSSFGGLP